MLTAEEAARMDEEDDDGDDGDDDGDGADGPVLPFSGIAEGDAATPRRPPPGTRGTAPRWRGARSRR